jgi:phenylpyruvate tautomerase PptA (4-oxalocrotonate tautomerase family)
MPTYFCATLEGRLTAVQKRKIASEITRVHCEVAGAPSFFVQVIFQEVKPGNYFVGGAPLKHDQLFVYGHIRSGRAAVDKSRMIAMMAKAVGDAADVENSRSVWVHVAELPRPTADREFMQSIGK